MQNALHGGEVGLPEIMHVEANLLDGVGDVGAGEHQVLEGPIEAPKVSRISNRWPQLGGDFGLCVHRHRNRLAVHHASMLKDIKSKPELSEEEFVHLMLYGDPQKVMEGSEVFHGEFSLEGRYGVLQKCCVVCDEDNVINIKLQVYHIYAVPEDE
jgi:hypothetical protein